ncbi:MAG TPA: hydrogenase maturation protease [Bryobacteraceae bacterium]|nr:hydrogenase maturation protease [Bryobacteraceae bacterium]
MRILCLGNELLGDDAAGVVVAEQLRHLLPADFDVDTTNDSGLDLLDHVVDTNALVVVDAVQTGASPGTVHLLDEDDLPSVCGASPHYVGLNEALRVGRALGLSVPAKIVILAIEVGDTLSFGAAMLPAVRAATPVVAEMILENMPQWS